MLTRIQIQGFKSLENVEVDLKPVVVLFGPNAVGKSNFLEATGLLSRLATERTLSDAFENSLRGYPLEAFTLPQEGLAGLLAQEEAELTLEGDVRTANGAPGGSAEELRYRVGVRISPKTGGLGVFDEYLQVLRGGAQKGPRIEAEGDHFLVRQVGRAGHPRVEPQGLNHTLASNLQFSGESRYPHFDRLRKELTSWQTYYLDPRVAMREPQPPRDVQGIGPQGELLAPFLHRLKAQPELLLHFNAIRRGLRSAIPTIESLDVDLDERRGTLDIVIRQNGVPFSSRVISEGTLRVLALCAIAANPSPSSLVAFEEPENGVQPRRIEVIADLLMGMSDVAGRQVIVTTHSPTLVGAMARRGRRSPERISLLRCSQEGRATVIRPFDPLGITEDQEREIRSALVGSEDSATLEAMLVRGWFDG